MSNNLFQYCQKLVLIKDDKVLLCKRKGEQDYDGVYSLIGGKLETSDGGINGGLKREKDEEIGDKCKIKVYTAYTTNTFFTKKDGAMMVLPHYYAEFISGDIVLGEEYEDYKWVKLNELDNFQPLIDTVPSVVRKMLAIKEIINKTDPIII